MSALLRRDTLDETVDDLLREAGGDYRLVIRVLLERREGDVSSGYVRRRPGDAR